MTCSPEWNGCKEDSTDELENSSKDCGDGNHTWIRKELNEYCVKCNKIKT